MTDPIADLLTRIRNASAAGHSTCEVGASKVKEQLARILREQGYIADFSVGGEEPKLRLTLELLYGQDGTPVIRGLERVSKPGRRSYRGARAIPKVLNGLGTAVVSTSQGLLTDAEARRRNLGGELVCNVW
jgi:small subunit ribosomal protein S8